VAVSLSRADVLAHRVRAQQLDRVTSGTVPDTNVLDLGVQDTGPDGARWALAIRGVDVDSVAPEELVLLWTLRGAPHAYRRADLPQVAAAVAPFSEADAGKRIFDASKPLTAAGIGNLEALDRVAAVMRSVVHEPMIKGELSARVTALVDEPYLRWCRPCQATHLYEMPFRLAAVRAGLELEPGTSPPVLRPIAGLRVAPEVQPRFDVLRGYLHLLGPATPKQVATFLDSPVAEVRSRWPGDCVEVEVDGSRAWALAEDLDSLQAGPVSGTRLLGPYDLFLQARDRDVLVPDTARHKALWPVLGRPGAVLHGGEIVGTWRPRASGKKLRLAVDLWAETAAARAGVEAEAERLATFRGATYAGLAPAG
jgi:hypothetical protein